MVGFEYCCIGLAWAKRRVIVYQCLMAQEVYAGRRCCGGLLMPSSKKGFELVKLYCCLVAVIKKMVFELVHVVYSPSSMRSEIFAGGGFPIIKIGKSCYWAA